MTELTLRRKLQKKAKHRPYGKCPLCGDRTIRRVRSVWGSRFPEYDNEKDGVEIVDRLVERCQSASCKYEKRSGGGTGRRIPTPQGVAESPTVPGGNASSTGGCAGSSPAPTTKPWEPQ